MTEATLPASILAVDGIVLRRSDPARAAAVVAAVNASLEHLSPWMAWAGRPAQLEQTAVRLALSSAAFDAGGDTSWEAYQAGGDEVIGGCGLHDRRGAGCREIGYWVHVDWTGRGVATRAAAAMSWVGFEVLGLDRVEIRCDVANERSAGVARRLGFTLERTLAESRGAPADTGSTMVWVLHRGDWPASAAAGFAVEPRTAEDPG